MSRNESLSIAVAHEWLDSRAGSEKTFEQIARAFPEADLYALTAEPGVCWELGGREVRTSFLDRSLLRGRRAWTLPLMPLAWRTLTKRQYDLVISSSHACAKGFWPGRNALHLTYCYTPMRYIWLPELDRRSGRAPHAAVKWLRRWDLKSADWVDSFAAISRVTADRIQSIYGRDSELIYPPVDTEFFCRPSGTPRRSYLLAFSRMIPYKKLDVAIEVAGRTGKRLVVAGWGPDEARLRQLAAQHAPDLVSFVVAPSAEELRELYQHASALIFPALEDFGIVPIEAQACGTPVVALDEGGSRDTVIHGVTGILVADQSVEAFSEAIAGTDMESFGPERCVAHTQSFSETAFIDNLRRWVERALAGRNVAA